MTDIRHPFDPSLTPFFSQEACAAANANPIDCRELFYALMHISERNESYPAAYAFITQQLDETEQVDVDKFIASYRPENLSTSEIPLPFKSDTIELTQKDLRLFLLQISPIILTEPCWLQFISQAATSQTPLAVDVTAVFLQLIGDDNRRKAYQSLLLSTGLELPDLAGWTYIKQATINESSFEFALLQSSLAHFPRVFFPEIVGFTLAFCRSNSLFDSLKTNENRHCLEHFLSLRRNQLSSVTPRVQKIASDYLSLFSEQRPQLWRRIQLGYWSYLRLFKKCVEDIQDRLGMTFSPFHELVLMLKKKAPAAVGHHRNVKLAGRTLDAWFSKSPFDGSELLYELRKSKYIDLENPAASLLLTLFDFNGPMFGIFNEAEKKIIRRWVVEARAEIPQTAVAGKPKFKKPPAMRLTGSPSIDFSKLKNRALFYYLVNADLYPEVATAARLKVRQVLRSAMLFNRLPFKHYGHQLFEDYVDRLYRREIEAYQPLLKKPKLSKEAYLWGIEQFAPTILTDGCWLQHIHLLKHYSVQRVGSLLFKIFDDETGNGKLEQNHPYVYQRLLQSVNIFLPPISSKEFIDHAGFIDSAFDLPVYLLSISKFPSAFLPELLGLNLAIELSGLGRVYLSLSEELKFWNIDSAIVDLHISIDNIASGHTALAVNAIQIYLDEISADLGEKMVHNHWRRIFSGYCSLLSACRVFKFALICRYLLRKMAAGNVRTNAQ